MKTSKKLLKRHNIVDESTRSKVQQEYPLPCTLTQLTNNLYQKYDNSIGATNIKYIYDILKGSTKRNIIKYKDCQDWDQTKQYLTETTSAVEAQEKFQEVVGYYVFYEDIPRLFIGKFSHIINRRVEQHRIVKYKALKNTLGVSKDQSKQNSKEMDQYSKCLPTGILEDQTQNSIQSLVKQLSVLINQKKNKINRYALTEGCLTLLRTNKKKVHKMKTLQSAKSQQKQRDKENQHKPKSHKNQKITIQRNYLISSSKDKRKSSRCVSSKRKQTKKKSVQQIVKVQHRRQNTRSPQALKQQKLKKKHIRMYSSQISFATPIPKQSRGGLGKTSCEHIEIDKNPKIKHTFRKKKTKFED